MTRTGERVLVTRAVRPTAYGTARLEPDLDGRTKRRQHARDDGDNRSVVHDWQTTGMAGCAPEPIVVTPHGW